MTIITNQDIDPQGIGLWHVRGIMFGHEATCFVGNIFQCAQYVRTYGGG